MQPDTRATRRSSARSKRLLVAMLPLALCTLTAFAQGDRPDLGSAPVAQLKRIYLACDHAATRAVLDMGTAAHCSTVGEELKHRAFDGDFERLIAWWRSEKDGPGKSTRSAAIQ